MRVHKSGHGALEFKLSVDELLLAAICETFNQGILASHDLGEIEADVLGANSPRLRMTRQVHDFRRVKQGLGGHATAQNAQTAHLLAPFDNHRLEPPVRS